MFFINVCAVYKKKNSKILTYTNVLSFLLFFVSERAVYGDHYWYKEGFFNSTLDDARDLMFNILIVFCRYININSYTTFLVVVYSLGVFFTYQGIKKITKNYHPLYAVMFTYIYPLCGVAIRQYLVLSLCIFALNFLYNKQYLRYLLFVIVAGLFHFSVFFSLVFFVPTFISNCKNERIRQLSQNTGYLILVASSLLAVSAYYYKSTPWLATLLKLLESNSYNDRNFAVYMVEASGNSGLVILPIYLSCLALSFYMKKCKDRVCLPNETRYIDFNHNIALYSSLLLPLIFVDTIFMRLLCITTVMNLVTYGFCLENRIFKSSGLNFLLFIGVLLSWLILDYFQFYECGSQPWIKETILYFG